MREINYKKDLIRSIAHGPKPPMYALCEWGSKQIDAWTDDEILDFIWDMITSAGDKDLDPPDRFIAAMAVLGILGMIRHMEDPDIELYNDTIPEH